MSWSRGSRSWTRNHWERFSILKILGRWGGFWLSCCVKGCASRWLRVCIRIWLCIWVRVWVSNRVCIWVSVGIWVGIGGSIRISIRICVCIRLCICISSCLAISLRIQQSWGVRHRLTCLLIIHLSVLSFNILIADRVVQVMRLVGVDWRWRSIGWMGLSSCYSRGVRYLIWIVAGRIGRCLHRESCGCLLNVMVRRRVVRLNIHGCRSVILSRVGWVLSLIRDMRSRCVRRLSCSWSRWLGHNRLGWCRGRSWSWRSHHRRWGLNRCWGRLSRRCRGAGCWSNGCSVCNLARLGVSSSCSGGSLVRSGSVLDASVFNTNVVVFILFIIIFL